MSYYNKINTIIKDQYGNTIRKFFKGDDYNEEKIYKYNMYNDLEEYKTIYVKNGIKQISETNYLYEYDNYKNKVIMKQTTLVMNKIVNQFSYYYINEYDEFQRIKKVTQSYDDKSIHLIIKYYYRGNLLVKKEEFLNSSNNAVKTHSYTYTMNGDLYEKKCCLNNEEIISYFVRYNLLSDGRYSKQLLSPIKGKYSWLVDEITEGMCSFYLKEETLSPDILKEICDFAISKYPSYNFIRIDICESEDITYRKELRDVENYYKQTYNLIIIHDF